MFFLNASSLRDVENFVIYEQGSVFSSTSHETLADFSYKNEQDKIIKNLDSAHQESVQRLIDQQYPLVSCEKIDEENLLLYPWSCHGQLEMIFSDLNSSEEKTLYGTGVLIGKSHVLTCAHNVLLSDMKRAEVLNDYGWNLLSSSIRVKFRQGKIDTVALHESLYSSDFSYPEEWRDGLNSMFDFAVIKFTDEFEGPAVNIKSPEHNQYTLASQPIQFIGYPLYDPETDVMQEAKASIVKIDRARVYYRIEVPQGSSGSSLFLTTNGNSILGIHTGIFKINVSIQHHEHISLIDLICSGGVYFNKDQVDLVQSWITH